MSATIRVLLKPSHIISARICAICGGSVRPAPMVATFRIEGVDADHYVCRACLAAGPESVAERAQAFAEKVVRWSEELADYEFIFPLPEEIEAADRDQTGGQSDEDDEDA